MLVDTRKTGTFQTPAGRGARFLLAFKVASDHDRVALCPDEDQARRMPPGLAELIISPQVEAAKRRLAKLERAGEDSHVSSTFERMAVIAADETGKILFVNSWATELTYYSAKEMIGTSVNFDHGSSRELSACGRGQRIRTTADIPPSRCCGFVNFVHNRQGHQHDFADRFS